MSESRDDRYARAVEYARNVARGLTNYDVPRPWQNAGSAPFTATTRRGRFWIVVFLLVSLLVCVSAAILVPSGLGAWVGYQQLLAQNHENAIQHFNRGLGFLAENYPELAFTEFEIAVKYDSSYEPAQQKLRDMQAQFGANGTPAAQDEQTRVAAALYSEAKDLAAQKQWSDAITRLEQLRTLNPGYQAQQVNDQLFQAYSEGGKAAVAAGQIELARERFDSALTVRANDPEMLRQRDLAVLYLDGQQAAGYNWRTAVQKFSALYQQDPNYDDVKKRLVDAYVQYGDAAAKSNAWCLAASEYDGALAITKDQATVDKRTQVFALCKQAIVSPPTPTPTPGAENYTWKVTTAADKACSGSGDFSGTVVDAQGHPSVNVPVGYYADGVGMVVTRTNANGQYQFVLGKEPGLFHIVIVAADGKTPVGPVVDAQYTGGNTAGCHLVVDWQKAQ